MKFNRIRNKIFFSMLLSTCIPLLITSGIIYYQITESIKRDNYLAERSIEGDLKGKILDYIQNLNETAYSIYYNQELLQSLKNGTDYQPYDSFYYDAQKDMREFFLNVYNQSRVQDITGITLLDRNDNYLSNFTATNFYVDDQYIENIRKVTETKSFTKPVIQFNYDNKYNEPVFQYIFPVNYMGDQVGTIIIDIKETYFRNMVEHYNLYYDGEISITHSNEIIYHTNTSLVGKDLNNYILSEGKNHISTPLLFSNWNLTYDYVTNPQHIFFLKIIIIIIALATLATITLAFVLSSTISKPVSTLHRKMLNIQDGNFDTRTEIRSNDEIGDLGRQFNNMAEKIQKLIEHDFKLQLSNKEAQIKALQAQISPHFLYNTLQTMTNIATVNQSREIKVMCQSLGNMYRYNMNIKFEWVNIRDELMHIRNYLVIINKRFPETIRVQIKMKPEFRDIVIPKLIIQPLVENAVEHGLIPSRRKKKLLKIYFEIDEHNKLFYIKILDNGVGITEERINEIEKMIKTGNFQGDQSIGVHNVHTRISLLCGHEYGLSLKSKENKGTFITIKLPLKRGSKSENSNR